MGLAVSGIFFVVVVQLLKENGFDARSALIVLASVGLAGLAGVLLY